MAVTRPGTNSASTREQPVAAGAEPASWRGHHPPGGGIRAVRGHGAPRTRERGASARDRRVPGRQRSSQLARPGFLVIMQLGNVLAAPALALAALARRRVRLAVDLAAAGLAAWLIAKVVKGIAQRPRPGAVLPNVIFRGAPDAGYGFVSGHAAVSVALATAASPYLGRRWRRLVWGLAVVVCLSRAYVGAHFPLDVVRGAAVGWAIGAALHLAVGAPGARLRPDTWPSCWAHCASRPPTFGRRRSTPAHPILTWPGSVIGGCSSKWSRGTGETRTCCCVAGATCWLGGCARHHRSPPRDSGWSTKRRWHCWLAPPACAHHASWRSAAWTTAWGFSSRRPFRGWPWTSSPG